VTSGYRIEKTEVTNRLYLDYLRAEQDPDTGSVQYRGGVVYSWDPSNPDTSQVVYLELSSSRLFFNLDNQTFAIQPGFEDHPVTGVTWYGANAYAVAYGLRLPTEAEWEIAARGANESWNYPFMDGIELTATGGPRQVNYFGSRTATDPFPGTTTPRGFFNGQTYLGFQTQDTPSAFGVYDMAGNVGEWAGDWLGRYPNALDIDPQGPVRGVYKVVRGGSYLSSRAGVRCTVRMGLPPDKSYISVGFRTAYIRPVPGR
jgi:formylglycine-generating enzyme required for sulfatase activity